MNAQVNDCGQKFNLRIKIYKGDCHYFLCATTYLLVNSMFYPYRRLVLDNAHTQNALIVEY